jgi:phosphatidylglycerophosphatase A
MERGHRTAIKTNITTLFGMGYLPFSASVSSLCAALVYLGVSAVPYPPLVRLLIHAALFATVLLWSAFALYCDQNFSSSDPREMVIDEFLGMYACLAIVASANVFVIVGLFVIFRVLDVFKPFPIDALDRACKSWWGVVFDDMAIGVLIAVVYHLLE